MESKLKTILLNALYRDSVMMLQNKDPGLLGGWASWLLIFFIIRKIFLMITVIFVLAIIFNSKPIGYTAAGIGILFIASNALIMMVYGAYKKYYTFVSIMFLEMILLYYYYKY